MNVLTKIWRGAGYLEGYGYHSGKGVCMLMIWFSMCAGALNKNMPVMYGALFGFCVGSLIFGGIFIHSCIARYNDWLKYRKNIYRYKARDGLK